MVQSVTSHFCVPILCAKGRSNKKDIFRYEITFRIRGRGFKNSLLVLLLFFSLFGNILAALSFSYLIGRVGRGQTIMRG